MVYYTVSEANTVRMLDRLVFLVQYSCEHCSRVESAVCTCREESGLSLYSLLLPTLTLFLELEFRAV